MEAQIVMDWQTAELSRQRDASDEFARWRARDADEAQRMARFWEEKARGVGDLEVRARRAERTRDRLRIQRDDLVDRLAAAGVGRGYPPGLWDVERDLPAAIDELLAERAGRAHG